MLAGTNRARYGNYYDQYAIWNSMLNNAVRASLWFVACLIAIIFAYLLAGIIHYAIGYVSSGDADVARMGWEKFPFN